MEQNRGRREEGQAIFLSSGGKILPVPLSRVKPGCGYVGPKFESNRPKNKLSIDPFIWTGGSWIYQLIYRNWLLKCSIFTDDIRILGGHKILANVVDRWEWFLQRGSVLTLFDDHKYNKSKSEIKTNSFHDM